MFLSWPISHIAIPFQRIPCSVVSSPQKSSEPIQEFVWGRKRTQLDAIPLPNAKIVRTDSNKTELQNLQKQVDMMNRSLHFCGMVIVDLYE